MQIGCFVQCCISSPFGIPFHSDSQAHLNALRIGDSLYCCNCCSLAILTIRNPLFLRHLDIAPLLLLVKQPDMTVDIRQSAWQRKHDASEAFPIFLATKCPLHFLLQT
jgi:hypothetical protein